MQQRARQDAEKIAKAEAAKEADGRSSKRAEYRAASKVVAFNSLQPVAHHSLEEEKTQESTVELEHDQADEEDLEEWPEQSGSWQPAVGLREQKDRQPEQSLYGGQVDMDMNFD